MEAESSKIGDLSLPKQVWQALCAAPRLHLQVDLDARADFTARSYADLVGDPARAHAIIENLRPQHPADRITAWHGMVDAGAWRRLARDLLALHYDPRYRRHRARHADGAGRAVTLAGLDDLDAATAEVEAALAGMASGLRAAAPDAAAAQGRA